MGIFAKPWHRRAPLKECFFAALLSSLFVSLLAGSVGAAERDQAFGLPDSVLLLGYPTSHQLELSRQQDVIKVQPPSLPMAAHSVFPSLSPDGKYLATAYMKSPYPNYREGIAVYSIREKSWHLFGDLSTVWSVSLSPDGSKLAAVADSGSSSQSSLLIIDRMTDEVEIRIDNFPNHGPLSWSPGRKSIAYTLVKRGPDPHLDTSEPDIELLDLATKRVRRLSEGAWPSWSPSGEWIAFINTDGDCTLIHPDGSAANVVAKVPRRAPWFRKHDFEFPPVWAPDSAKLLLNEAVNEENGRLIIQLLDVGTGKLQRQTRKGVAVFGWASEK